MYHERTRLAYGSSVFFTRIPRLSYLALDAPQDMRSLPRTPLTVAPGTAVLQFSGQQFELHLRAAARPEHSPCVTSSGPIEEHLLHYLRPIVQRGMPISSLTQIETRTVHSFCPCTFATLQNMNSWQSRCLTTSFILSTVCDWQVN